MTKQEELDKYRMFYESLPAESYLRDILEGLANEVQTMIRSDLAWPIFGRLRDVVDAEIAGRAELRSIGKQIEGLRDIERERRKKVAELESEVSALALKKERAYREAAEAQRYGDGVIDRITDRFAKLLETRKEVAV